jgi:hypothetical protein
LEAVQATKHQRRMSAGVWSFHNAKESWLWVAHDGEVQ